MTSFPLLILAGLAQTDGVLKHLFRIEIDLTSDLVRRGSNYILLNAFVSELLRSVHRVHFRLPLHQWSSAEPNLFFINSILPLRRVAVSPLLPKVQQPIYLPVASDEDDDESVHPAQPDASLAPPKHTTDIEHAPSEQTPLLSSPSGSTIVPAFATASPLDLASQSTGKGGFWSYVNPLVVSSVVALLIALVPGVQRFVFGGKALGGVRVGGLVGGTIGTAVGWLGAAYAVTELLGGGGGLRYRDA